MSEGQEVELQWNPTTAFAPTIAVFEEGEILSDCSPVVCTQNVRIVTPRRIYDPLRATEVRRSGA